MLSNVDLMVIGDVVDELKNRIGCFKKNGKWTITIYSHGSVAKISQDENGLRNYSIEKGFEIVVANGTPVAKQLDSDFAVTTSGDFVKEDGSMSSVFGSFMVVIAVLATMRCLLDVYAPMKEDVRKTLKGFLVQTPCETPAFRYGAATYAFVCDDIFGLENYEDEDRDYIIMSVSEINFNRLKNFVEKVDSEKEGGEI